jgi:hypothetical protein
MSREWESSVSPGALRQADSLDGLDGGLHIHGSVRSLEMLSFLSELYGWTVDCETYLLEDEENSIKSGRSMAGDNRIDGSIAKNGANDRGDGKER